MPKPVIRLSATALAQASAFCCGSLRAFIVLRKNTLIALHGQFGIITQAIVGLFLPSDTAILVNYLDKVVPLAIASG